MNKLSYYNKHLLIFFLTSVSLNWSQIVQPYPPLNIVNIPTAGTLPRGTYTLETLLINNGGFVPKLAVGFTDNFCFGVSFGIQNIIGNLEPSINKPTPEVQMKYRMFDETQSMPALVYGLDTQGKGRFTYEITNNDTIIDINRYQQKAWGLYVVASKNWNLVGNLGLHIGMCKNYWENDDGDRDINLFLGIDKEINRSFSLLIDYDAALNDNNYDITQITFGKDKGYLNAGIRWAINSNIMLELDLNDINLNTEAKFMNREFKIIYSEEF